MQTPKTSNQGIVKSVISQKVDTILRRDKLYCICFGNCFWLTINRRWHSSFIKFSSISLPVMNNKHAVKMFSHFLCSCFILTIYCFVKITDETLEEWFETTDSMEGEAASALTTISSKHCSARQALNFYVHLWKTKHLLSRIANFRWVWETFRHSSE